MLLSSFFLSELARARVVLYVYSILFLDTFYFAFGNSLLERKTNSPVHLIVSIHAIIYTEVRERGIVRMNSARNR